MWIANKTKQKYSTDPQMANASAQYTWRKSDFQFFGFHTLQCVFDKVLRNVFDKLIAIYFVRSLWMGIDHFGIVFGICTWFVHFNLIHLWFDWRFKWTCAFVCTLVLWWVRNRILAGFDCFSHSCFVCVCVCVRARGRICASFFRFIWFSGRAKTVLCNRFEKTMQWKTKQFIAMSFNGIKSEKNFCLI